MVRAGRSGPRGWGGGYASGSPRVRTQVHGAYRADRAFMSDQSRADATQLLGRLKHGDDRAAGELLPLIYDEMRAVAARFLRGERANHTLQPTALVHEAFLRLVDQKQADYQSRAHFLAIGAQVMRRVLIDHARAHGRLKRGGSRQRLQLDEALALVPQHEADLLALNELIDKLRALDERQAKIVELRFFSGMTVDEVATVLGVSKRTVEGDWMHARAWLAREMGGEPGR